MREAPGNAQVAAPDAESRQGPQRTCVGCRRTRDKRLLLRLVRTEGSIRFDEAQRLEGRGVYVCSDRACVEAAGRRGGLAVLKALRMRTSRAPGPTEQTEQVHAALGVAASHVAPDGDRVHHKETIA